MNILMSACMLCDSNGSHGGQAAVPECVHTLLASASSLCTRVFDACACACMHALLCVQLPCVICMSCPIIVGNKQQRASNNSTLALPLAA
jgi:hypothetical protein